MVIIYKTGVYTKNRNFRLYKSSKVGKNVAFTVAEDNKFVAKPEKGISAEEGVFLASLVCNLRYTEQLNLQISCPEIIGSIKSQRSSSLLRIISFTGQRILTWDVPETKGAKTSRLDCQQGSATGPGSAEVTQIGSTCRNKLQVL